MTGRNPIEHVVLIIKENHTFDNYFGTFPGTNGAKFQRAPNPPPQDHDHRHEAWLVRKQKAPRQQFVEQDIPAYFAYARQFTLCDTYFTDVAGPSTPNHLMLIAADSPVINNPPGAAPPFKLPSSLPRSLEKAHLAWGYYGPDGYPFNQIENLKGRNQFTPELFKTDASAGKLPAVSWVYAPHYASEHPRGFNDTDPRVGNVTVGMQWTVDQVNTIITGGLWSKAAIFITWDDWGGWFDHVDPPNIESWKADGTQFRYGSRVGCLVLSPYAKRGYISKVRHSHVSLLKFCEKTFGLPPLNQRDTKADDMSDCFDFKQQPSPPPKPAP